MAQICALQIAQKHTDLSLIRVLTELAFKINNVVQLHEHNLPLLKAYCEFFYQASFTTNELTDAYSQLDGEGKQLTNVEQILANGLSFYSGLLEHPGVWDVEMLNEGQPLDEQELVAEKFLT